MKRGRIAGIFFVCLVCLLSFFMVQAQGTDAVFPESGLQLGLTEDLDLTALLEAQFPEEELSLSTDGTAVDIDGLTIKAVEIGSASLQVLDGNGTTLASSSVSVKELPGSISFAQTSVSLQKGETLPTQIQIPEGNHAYHITYESSNPSVVTCDKQGVLTAVGSGSAEITATLSNGVYTSCTVTVEPIAATLNKTAATVGVGEQFVLTATVTGTSEPPVFQTSNPAVAEVGTDGTVTAKGIGTASIYLTVAGEQPAACEITVKAAPASISLNKTNLTLGVGEKFNLNSGVNSGAASSIRSYTSSNPAVATVPGSIVTAKKAGTTTITVKTYNGKTATCKVTVKAAPRSISLNKTSLTLGVGETYNLNSYVSSGSASNTRSYTSSDPSVATVPGSIVTAKKIGTTIITVKTYNGKTATCKVTVKAAPRSISLNKTSLTLGVGEKFNLNSSVSTGSASTTRIYTSSNASVATVPNSVVTAKRVGTTTITVKTYNGKTATCKVTVKAAPRSISLNKTSLTLGVGETYNLDSYVNSGSASSVRRYTSSNSSVATVPGSIVTAKKVGTATITVKTYNGKKATCTVTVKPAPKSIGLNERSVIIAVGETLDLDSYINSGSASSVRRYTSSNSSVAAVKSSIVTGKKAGTATITVKTYNGKTAACKITVKSKESQVVRTMYYPSKVNYTTGLYADKALKTRLGTVKAGASVTCIDRNMFSSSKIVTSGGKRGWVSYSSISFGSGNYTQKTDYTTAVKESYINSQNLTSSSKYLVWINLRCQKVNLFQKKDGKWDLFRTCTVSTGANNTPTPTGTFTAYAKLNGWFYSTTYIKPIVYFLDGGYAMHSREHWYSDGSLVTTTIGRPISHGCVRMYDNDINWIYKNIPIGTTVYIF